MGERCPGSHDPKGTGWCGRCCPRNGSGRLSCWNGRRGFSYATSGRGALIRSVAAAYPRELLGTPPRIRRCDTSPQGHTRLGNRSRVKPVADSASWWSCCGFGQLPPRRTGRSNKLHPPLSPVTATGGVVPVLEMATRRRSRSIRVGTSAEGAAGVSAR